MSSAVVSTSAALSRPFVFDADHEAEECLSIASSIDNRKSAVANSVRPASRLEIRPAPEMASSGIPELDSLTGGLPRGCLTEVCGPASSGRTTLLLAALSAATRRGEFCVVVDACDALDPRSVAAAGIELDRLLWVRCGENLPQKQKRQARGKNFVEKNLADRLGSQTSEHRLEQALRATDLLLESGGFGLIVLDFADLPLQAARRIPLTTWFRFRRAVEYKSTILLAIEQQATAGSCSSLLLQFSSQFSVLSSQNTALQKIDEQERKLPHTHLLTGLEISAEFVRSRAERKPARSVSFKTKTAWAG